MTTLHDAVKKIVVMSLRDKSAPTSAEIKQHITAVVQLQRTLGRTEEIDEESLHREILSQVNTWQADPSVLRDGKHRNWVPDRRMEIEWKFWKRYRQYLEDEKTWPQIVTGKLDKVTDLILGDIGNPYQKGAWDRRGMVVGEVQSGKTANYTGLICKAVDAGYKLIIVLAGLTNDLRSQTQSRLDAEFLGFESEVGKISNNGSRIGVGLIEDYGHLIAHPLTYSAKDGDFRKSKSSNLQLGGSPLLLVVKKNASVLKRILEWVEGQGKPHPLSGRKVVDEVPLLLLDDEADNASINTKAEDEDPTSINRAIRLILNAFQQSSYVGYTATPFANIFILPDEDTSESKYGPDLFPKGFIYNISPPSSYVGASQLFGLSEDPDADNTGHDGLPLIRYAKDAEITFFRGHKKTHGVDELPQTMLEALKAFVIVCAARRVRGQTEVHNSMLIHVTRFNLVQGQVMELVNTCLVEFRRMLEFRTGSQALELVSDFKRLWNQDFLPTSQKVMSLSDDPELVPVEWADVEQELVSAITRIQVRGINGDSGEALDYNNNPNGLNVIAVGGDKLSRGLTLEGLSVSYYVRPATNYDTLLQMGRWFGYRPGYLDLCRLYTTETLEGWYEHIAVASEELRREFNFMELSHLTPEQYGLKVRTSPDGLNITAANKIRHGRTMRVSFADHLAQTTIFHKDAGIHQANFDAVSAWLRSLKGGENTKRGVEWQGISAEKVIEFLKGYTSHPLCRQTDSELLSKYIQKLNSFGELNDWTVALISSGDKEAKIAEVAGHSVGLIQRTDSTPDEGRYMLKNANILNPPDEAIGLEKAQWEHALAENKRAFHDKKTRLKKEPTKPSGPFIRRARPPQKGLVLLYPLDHKKTGNDSPFSNCPIMGFALSFPGSQRGEQGAVEYEVNTTYWNEYYGDADDES